MKKLGYCLAGVLLVGALLSGCGKKGEDNKGSYSPNTNGNISVTTAENGPIVNINNIIAYVGDTIDYMASIQSVENMELEKSMIYIDSSGVDTSTPGTYTATYSFDYMGTTVSRMITVTIEPNPKKEVETSISEEITQEETEETSASKGEEETPSTKGEDNTIESTSGKDGQTADETSSDNSAGAVTATLDTLEEQDIPDASITLSNGAIVTIKCTSSRYIVETFTDETYYDENGFTYLKSELKVAFNTGDIQVVETVITRVASNPQQE